MSIQNNEVWNGGATAAGIFLHRSSDNAIVNGNYIHDMQVKKPNTKKNVIIIHTYIVAIVAGMHGCNIGVVHEVHTKNNTSV